MNRWTRQELEALADELQDTRWSVGFLFHDAKGEDAAYVRGVTDGLEEAIAIIRGKTWG